MIILLLKAIPLCLSAPGNGLPLEKNVKIIILYLQARSSVSSLIK